MNGMSDHVNSTPESLDMGGAPPHNGHWLDQPPVGDVQNWQFFKTTRCARALSLVTLFRSKETRSPTSQGRPGRLDARPRNQPSEEVQDRAKAVTSRSNEFNDCRAEERELSRWRHAAVSSLHTRATEEARTDHVIPATKNWANTLNSRETKPKHPACFNKASIISISDWTGKYDLNAYKAYVFVRDLCWLVKLRNRNNVIISTLTSNSRMCVLFVLLLVIHLC